MKPDDILTEEGERCDFHAELARIVVRDLGRHIPDLSDMLRLATDQQRAAALASFMDNRFTD